MDITPEASDEKWKLCCSSLHKTEIVFFSQIIFIFTLTIFSIIQIVNNAVDTGIYFSILSACLGIMIPSPSLQPKK